MEKINAAKKDLLYSAIDAAPDFYKGTAEKASRSWMNVTMRLPTEALENKFVADAKKEGLLGLKGHRSVGGIRFSIYNAVSLEDITEDSRLHGQVPQVCLKFRCKIIENKSLTG